MAWLRFVGITFNLFGALFVIGALVAILVGALLGAPTDFSTPETSTIFGILFGMMGTIGALASFFAAMIMFFFGAVALGLRRMMIDTHAMRVALELGASEASARKAPLPMGEGLG
jgi:hypothetical protein